MATMSALGPAGAWEIASTRSPPFIAKRDEHRSSGGGPANEDYNIMSCRICINRFWLVGNKAIILVGFPLLYMYSWCQSLAVDANWHTDKRLCSFHEISMSCTNIAKSTVGVLESHPSEIPFALQVWYHIRANEMPSNWRHLAMRFLHANLIYRVHLPNSPSKC